MWNWIKTFAIITQADSRWSDLMRSSHFVNIKEECLFNGDRIESHIVLNAPERTLKVFCRKNGIEHFVYCQLRNENDRMMLHTYLFVNCLENRRYRKAGKKHRQVFKCVKDREYLIQDSIKDNHLIISAGPYECALPIDRFMELDNIIRRNLKSFDRRNLSHFFNLANNGVGLTPWYYRNRIYKGCLL